MAANAQPSPATAEHSEFLTRLDAQLHERIAAIDSAAVGAGADAAILAQLIGVLMQGGKRMRARLAFSAWGGYLQAPASEPAATVLALGAGLELFQAAALLHDDIIDRSETRRGAASAHVVLSAAHRNQQGTGDSAHFGTAGAILAGDLALIAADDAAAEARELAAQSPHADRIVPRLRELWREMAIGVTAGQYLDLYSQSLPDWGENTDRDRARSLEVVLAKSARYSVEFPLVLGATLAGASPDEAARLAGFGRPLGEAFQLRDDVLGVFGDPAVTGKPAGDDIREGKRTALLTETLVLADPRDGVRLTRLVRAGELPAKEVAWITRLMASTGALERVEAMIAMRLEASLSALAECSLRPDAAEGLRQLAIANVTRSA
ncbi:polyprenyl synthetase family protein [Rarobacter faecitabidus]|uniref:Geranylgeranyl diphosphate synthase type I n=1 Tax=Rarobacter faecitabidus TaxID=13243 RepID=A0A542ZVF3_RARFA|nr:polyprenyl synthetase family protein [Rarobacter faecitabidus]TQL64343.1 geranylgeranyl diphosphate synthase type I [Rarobacter faecitabidus]